MNYLTISLTILLSINTSYSQKSKLEIDSLRLIHLNELTDTIEGVLNSEEVEHFKGLDYFDFSLTYQVETKFKKRIGRTFEMATSTDRKPVYRRYGRVKFKLNGKKCKLEVYQNIALSVEPEYTDYLFIPFRDLTSRKETYGGGRYLDVIMVNGKTMLLDFNLAYNPYCAYSYRYSCPIPPEVNTLKIEVKSGEKTPLSH